MKNVQPDMNIGRQRRKLTHAISEAPSAEHRAYLEHLLSLFEAAVADGQPRPAGDFLPMYYEEFDIADT